MSSKTWLGLSGLALLVAAGIAALGTPARTQDAKKGKKYALLVGVTEYDSGKFATLKYTENDVSELAKILKSKAGGFDEIRVLSNSRGAKDRADAPTAVNIRKALADLTAARKKHDTVLIALAGHGLQLEVHDPEEKGQSKTYSYFCPVDSDLRGVSYSTGKSKTLLNVKEVFGALDDCGAGTRLVLMDACRNELKADSAARSLDVRKFTIPEGVGVMFSCKAGQKAFESARFKHGVFFHYVLQGLRGEAKNKRGEVTWDRLTEYVKEQVSEAVPTLIGDGATQDPHAVGSLSGKSPVLVGTDTAVVDDSKGKEKGKDLVVKKPGGKWIDLFNGTDLTGWEGEPGTWKVKDGEITATSFPKGRKLNTFLCSKKSYKDFEVEFDARIEGTNNSGLMIRSKLTDRKLYYLNGVKCDLGARSGWGTLVTYDGKGGRMISNLSKAPVQKWAKQDDFNRVLVRCVGQKVTVRINDQPFEEKTILNVLPGEGVIGFQLRYGDPSKVTLKNIRLRDLSGEE